MRSRPGSSAVVVNLLGPLLLSSSSYSIPAFSRQYGRSCRTRHLDFPKLNDFGKAFKETELGPLAHKPGSCWPGMGLPRGGQFCLSPNCFKEKS